jgi:drug/metabolite transporter (DMT)-like permease
MGFLLYGLGQRMQVYGNQLGTASNSAVLVGLDPVLTSVAAALFLHERVGPRRLAGFALGLAGVALLNRVWRADFQWTGLGASLAFVLSFVCEAAYSVMGKPIVARASIMKMLALSLLAGTALNLLVDGPRTLAAARMLGGGAWLLLWLLAVVCTAIGYSLWFMVIRECPINVAALTIFAQSVFGVLLAAVWLRERLHWGHLLGGATIAAGLALGLSRQVKKGR